MKTIRKTILAVLALVIALVLFVPTLAYGAEVAKEEVVYSEKYVMALQTLYQLGIMPDYDLGKYDQDISREQFATCVGALLGGRTVFQVPQPANQAINLDEAVRMLIDETENTIRAEKYGYMVLAGQMGITHGLTKLQGYDNLAYGAAAQMLYNSMMITPGTSKTISADGSEYIFDESETVLSKHLNLEYRSGFVTADNFWSLNPSEKLSDNQIMINGQRFFLKNPVLDDYVGFYVRYYYSAKDDMIIAVEKPITSNRVVLRSSDITGYDNLEYNCYMDGMDKKFRIAENAYIVSNFVPDFSANIDMCPADADIILIDADGDDTYETVFIKTYTEIKVSVIDDDKNTISGKTSGTYILSDDYPARVYLNGEKAEYSSITSGIHASLVVEPETDIVREIYLSDKRLEGTISEVTNDHAQMTVRVDEVVYPVTQAIAKQEILAVGMNVTLALNFKGEVAWSDSNRGTEGIGYLMAIHKETGLEGTVRIKLLAEDGSFPIYNLTKKCTLNGENVAGNIEDVFTDDNGTVQQLISYKTNADNEIYDITLPLSDASALKYGENKLHTVLELSESNSFSESSSSFQEKILIDKDTVIFNVPKYNSTNEREYTVDEKPVSDYVKIYGYRINDPYADVVVSERQTPPVTSDGVCGGPGPAILKNQTAGYSIVKSVKKVYVEEYGCGVDAVEFIDSETGRVREHVLADNAMYVAFGRPTAQVEVISYSVGEKDLQPGDLFSYSLNSMDELGTIHKVYDASAGSLVKGKWNSTSDNGEFNYTDSEHFFGTWSTCYVRLVQGYAVDAGEDYLAVTSAGYGNDITTMSRDELKFFKSNDRTWVYKIRLNGTSSEIREISLGQVRPATSADEKVVVTLTSGANIRLVAIYEEK